MNVGKGDSMLSMGSQKQSVSQEIWTENIILEGSWAVSDTVKYQLWAGRNVNMSQIVLSKNRAKDLYIDERVLPPTVTLQ